MNTELLKEPVRADLMYTVTWGGVQMGFHIEFQKRHDTDMGRRVWRYRAEMREAVTKCKVASGHVNYPTTVIPL